MLSIGCVVMIYQHNKKANNKNEMDPEMLVTNLKNDEDEKTDKIYDIRERTLKFGIRIMEIAKDIPTNKIYSSVRSQIVSSGTAIGANIAEGDGAKTKRDFISKLVVARKEAKEEL